MGLAHLVVIGMLSGVAGAIDAAPRSEERVVAEEGFAVTRPAALEGWGFRTSKGQGGSHVLQLAPDATGLVDFKVESKKATGATDEVLRDQLVTWTASQPNLEDVQKVSIEIAGKQRPGIQAETEIAVGRFRLFQFVVVENGRQYQVGYHGPVTRFEELAPKFASILATLRFQPPVEKPVDERAARLEALAAQCGSEIEWFTEWAAAARTASRQKRWVLVLVHSLPGFDIPTARRSALFSDPDLVELIQSRFVMLELDRAADSPFKAQESYGMGPSTFGTSLLCVNADGRVVYEVASVQPSITYQELCTVLAQAPDRGALEVASQPVGLATIQEAMQRGELTAAEKWLSDHDSGEAHLLRADLLRRQRRGEEALKELAAAQAAGADPVLFHLNRARLLPSLGRVDQALEALSSLKEADLELEQLAMYRVLLGTCRLARGERVAAEEIWNLLIDEQPESRWAWPIAAALMSPALRAGYDIRVRWPDEDMVAGMLHQPAAPVAPNRLSVARQTALDYLLGHQRENGAWVSPSEVSRANESTPDPLSVAVTAICIQSLLPELDRPEAKEAIESGFARLQVRREHDKKAPKLAQFMDYTVWSHPYLLWTLADSVAAGALERSTAEPWVAELLEHLRMRQKGGGGWSYYLTPDIDQKGPPLNISMSFTSALVLLALHRVQEEGFELPEGLVDRGLGCLERMRGDNGAFDYLLMHDQEDLPRQTGVVGASGRGPICELALLRWGRGSRAHLEKSLDVFFEHRHLLRKEQGKRLMHAGPDGLGSHYPMFDYFFAALASRELGPEKSRQYVGGIAETILSARAADGSYVDNPMIGRPYATAMALMTFRFLD